MPCPDMDEVEPAARAPFAYALIRVVPRVEREEFVNAGVVLFSRPRRFLGVRTAIDGERLRALWPELDLEAVQRQLDLLGLVAAGDSAGGAIARLPAAERFGWMTAPASTVVQPGPVHAGLAEDAAAELEALFSAMVGKVPSKITQDRKRGKVLASGSVVAASREPSLPTPSPGSTGEGAVDVERECQEESL